MDEQQQFLRIGRSARQLARKYQVHKTLAAIDRNDPPQQIIKIALGEVSLVGLVDALETSAKWDWEHGERHVRLPDLTIAQCQKLIDVVRSLPFDNAGWYWAWQKVLIDMMLETKERFVLDGLIEHPGCIAETTEIDRVRKLLSDLPDE